jgi:FkbM family methyltransferase
MSLLRALRHRFSARAPLRERAKEGAMQLFRSYCERLPELVLAPVFVKVGANDGVTGDPCSDLLLAHPNWAGLLVEPVPHYGSRLRANFNDAQRFRIEQVAVGAINGRSTFYYVDPAARAELHDLPSWFDQIGSFDRNHIMKHLDGILAPYIIEVPIEVCTLTKLLLRNNIDRVDLLHIDAEGYDYEVLAGCDFSLFAPLLILVEHKHLNAEKREKLLLMLRERQYLVRDCGRDYFAVNEHAYRDLARRDLPAG